MELTELYGAGVKYLVNGIVFRRLSVGFAIAQSAEVNAAAADAPKRAAAHQRAARAIRGKSAHVAIVRGTEIV